MKTVAVIGAGAAGYFSAITAAEADPRCRVLLFEQSRRPLAKVAVSGGGRCNVTHHCFDPRELVRHYPRGGKELRGAFHRWQPQDTIDWFAARHVTLKTEADGRMFPTTDRSQTIIDCLTRAAEEAKVELRIKTGVSAVYRQGERFRLELSTGECLEATHIILTSGGGQKASGHAIAASLDHTITSLAPSLFTFHIEDPLVNGLAGLSLPNARVAFPEAKLTQRGPVLFTHWGLSGPGILKLSAWGARLFHERDYRFEIAINWLADTAPEIVRERFESAKTDHARKALASLNPFDFPKRFWERLLQLAQLSTETQWSQLPKKQLNDLVQRITDTRLQVSGKSMNKEEFVTCGGVDLKEIDFKTMQSKRCPNLYLAGEVLDIDGVTGGFNFQAAWTTARIAGEAVGHA